MATPPTGLPVGAPSKYKPEYCDMIGPLLADGYSIFAFAAEIDVSRATINNWMAEHPEFLEAVNKAKSKAAYWWERRLRIQAEAAAPPGSVTASIFALKNLGDGEWRDRTENRNDTTIHAGDGVAELLTAINGGTRSL